MIAQETKLKIRRISRTTLATGPVSPTKSIISPPTTAASKGYRFIVFRRIPAWIIDHGSSLNVPRNTI
jgi:hypothetical protein